MKKLLILFAGLALLVSCAKTIDIVDEKEKPTDPSKDPVRELTLSTYANLTKAIAEGEDVPTDNFIGLLPRFFSDVEEGQHNEDQFKSYNQITNFGYDFNAKVWRGLGKYRPTPFDTTGMNLGTKGLMQDLQKENFPFNPFYWPGGDRVAMDYVAYSYCNLLDVLISAVDRYASPFLEGNSVTNIPLSSMLGGLKLNPNNAYGILDYLAVADPWRRNENRMDVWYQYNIMNLLTIALSQAFNDVAIEPIALAIIVALDKVVDDAKNNMELISLENLDELFRQYLPTLIGMIFGDSDNTPSNKKESKGAQIQELLAYLPQDEVKFVMDYYKAFEWLTREDGYQDIIGEGEKQITKERLNEVANKAFLVFLTKFADISKYLQDDLLYSYGRSVKNNNGSVKATFNHAKSWVKVLVNNKSNKDIFVAGVAFEDVRTGGTLVIDNSKSGFEAYWDFEASRGSWHYEQEGQEPYDPSNPDGPDESGTGVDFESYIESGTLTKSATTKAVESASPLDEKTKNALMALLEGVMGDFDEEDKKEFDKIIEMVYGTGLIPDSYYVPSNCYGPAKDLSQISLGGEDQGLRFTCLNSSNPVSDALTLADKLGGVMLPAKEPGRIKISYYSWENAEQKRSVGSRTTIDTVNMVEAVPYLSRKLSGEDLREVTLNLPRTTWRMGRKYIYVINISDDNELTIEAHETEWKPEYVTPFVGPDVPGNVEPLRRGEDIDGKFITK